MSPYDQVLSAKTAMQHDSLKQIDMLVYTLYLYSEGNLCPETCTKY